jgi:alpha-ketoglutarate-dependent taurine dioxygenase|tara:strand:- start:1300 stop:2217 length:918 start_codon:yes stop_codon:yes gene_type:complete
MASSIDVNPLSIHIGAEIGGVDLSQPLSADTVEEIRAALLKWKVIFFHDQDIDHDSHLAFAKQLGEPTIGHAVFGHIDGYPEIYSIAKKRAANQFGAPKMVAPWTGWHADITSAINPPAISILRGVTLPPYGGDTQWTNLAAAYDGLSETLRAFVDTLRGLHYTAAPAVEPGTKAYEDYFKRRKLVSEHPIVRVHPETGERALYVSPSYLKEIVGMTPRESQYFMEMLWEHAVRQEYTVRFRWRDGDIAVWDNRAACHHAPTDIFEVEGERQLYRITLVGDVPVGVDGTPSKAIEGDPITAWAAE